MATIIQTDGLYDANYYFREAGWIEQELDGHRWIFNWGASESSGIWRNDGAIVTTFDLTETTFEIDEKFFGASFRATGIKAKLYTKIRDALEAGNEEKAWKVMFSKADLFDGSSDGEGPGFAHHFLGYAGDDRIIGGDSADELDGGKGNDRIIGNQGVDFITGGKGKDKLTGDDTDGSGGLRDYFIYASHKESRPGKKKADVITDFRDSDAIRLDFDFKTDTDDQIEFLAKVDDFTGSGGQVRYRKKWVELDMDGDMQADFAVQVGKGKTITVVLNQIFGADATPSNAAPQDGFDTGLETLSGDIWG